MAKSIPLITDGRKLTGAAMPKILADFRQAVIGKRIIDAGYINLNGDGEAWPVLILEGAENIIIQRDDECNGPGVAVTSKDKSLCQTRIA